MENVVSALTTTISNANLWGEVAHTIPLVGVAVLFALGYRIYKKLTNGVSKAKVKM